jgi:hypothetical protein
VVVAGPLDEPPQPGQLGGGVRIPPPLAYTYTFCFVLPRKSICASRAPADQGVP